MDAFARNGDRYNLLNSAVLELLEYIRKVCMPVPCFHSFSFFSAQTNAVNKRTASLAWSDQVDDPFHAGKSEAIA